MKLPQKPPSYEELSRLGSSALAELLHDRKVAEFVRECNREYLHWDVLRHKVPRNIDPKLAWFLVKMSRTNNYKTLQFGGWSFRYLLSDDSFRKLHLLDMGTAGQLETGLASATGGDKDRYIISSLMEEAIASSIMEGAATTRKVAKEFLRRNKAPKTYAERMIVNGYQTMQKVAKMKSEKLSPQLLLHLHKSITDGTLKDGRDEGRFRDSNDIVVGRGMEGAVVYNPPDYRKIPKLMEEFCDLANDDAEFIHPVVKAVILHFLIGYIHPFNDGNGRTARTLFYWYLLSKGYWLFEYMAVSRILRRSKKKYDLAYLYTETDGNDLTYFINYNLSAIEEAQKDMEAYIARKRREQADALRLVRGLKRVNLRQAGVLERLANEPDRPVTINEVVNTYGVVYQTARDDLLKLAEAGYLKKIKLGKQFVFRLEPEKLRELSA